MTPEQQRIAIAEWAGWLVISNTLCNVKPDKNGNPELEPVAPLPDYLNDLNAVHALENSLPDKLKRSYAFRLARILRTTPTIDLYDQFLNIHATAAQRCEALLKTLNLWKP